ncbi:MAG: hypothetical protein K2M68_05020, partial [Muribaculaceae bacterium]|nr:hypothetical protein [Muribaculaceae bacterium]
NDAKTKISWADFVKAINNPETVKGVVDPESTVAKTYATAQARLTAAQTALETRTQEKAAADSTLNAANEALATAKADQTKAGQALTAAQKAYTDANDEYTDAVGNQGDANTAITAKQKQIDGYNADLKKRFDDVIASNQATIKTNETNYTNAVNEAARYGRLIDALYVATTKPEDWLTAAEEKAEAFNSAYGEYMEWYGEMEEAEKDPEEETYTGANANIYINVVTSNTTTKRFNISFDDSYNGVSGWTKYDVAGFENKFMPTLSNAKATAKWYVTYYFGSVSGDKTASIGGITTSTYALLSETLIDALKDLEEEPGYCTEGDKTIPANSQNLYREYVASQQEYQTKAQGYLDDNEKLQSEIVTLEQEKETDPVTTQLATAETELETLQSQLAGYTATVNKYRATKDAEGNAYIGANGATVTYITYLNYQQTVAQTAKTEADNAVTEATNAVNVANTAQGKAETAVSTAETALHTAESNLADAETRYEAAQKEADATATAAAQEKYNEITLDKGTVIDATEPITKDYAGTIYAQGAIFNVNIADTYAQTSLFNKFSGHVDDAAINGTFARNFTGSSFADVARWDGNGKIYNESGAATEYNTTEYADAFGAFGYALRNNQYYGVTFDGMEIVAKNEAPSQVYNITAYDLPAGMDDTEPSETQLYVQLASKGSTEMLTLENDKAVTYTVPENRFAKAADNIQGLGLTNVFYGANNTCENVKIVEQNNNSFYCPVTVQAQNISYARKFSAGYNSVCLPFEVKATFSDQIASICQYESVDYDAKKFWFLQKETDDVVSVPANTPVLLVMKDGAADVELDIKNVKIGVTPKSQITSAKAMNDATYSFGTMKSANATEFQGMQNSSFIYGLNKDKQFIAAASSAKFPAFRMVIGTTQNVNPNKVKAMNGETVDYSVMGIGIHDGNGNDVTDNVMAGVEDVIADGNADVLTVAGGQGEIIITAKADYGQVEIYNLNGVLVDVVDVIEGTTTIGVSKGFYIVMGQKVVVK